MHTQRGVLDIGRGSACDRGMAAGPEAIGSGSATYTGSFANNDLAPGSVIILVGGVNTLFDDGLGQLRDGSNTDMGDIDYSTGDYDLEFGIDPDLIQKALSGLSGVKRRLEILHESNELTVISDYGHHPTEVLATLKAVRCGWKDEMRALHVVFQPHRFTRTRDCFAS